MLYTDEKLKLFDLTGKTAIVTGSTRGIGNAIAFRFAQQGANVVVCGTNAEKAQGVAKEINQKIGACHRREIRSHGSQGSRAAR